MVSNVCLEYWVYFCYVGILKYKCIGVFKVVIIVYRFINIKGMYKVYYCRSYIVMCVGVNVVRMKVCFY